MSRKLEDLAPVFYPKACEFLAKLTEARIPVVIVDTLRTEAEHAANLANGVSWTKHSKHVDGLAMDVCPYASYLVHGPNKLLWDGRDPTWDQIGAIAEACGLVWGGRWRVRDLGHVEMPTPATGGTRV